MGSYFIISRQIPMCLEICVSSGDFVWEAVISKSTSTRASLQWFWVQRPNCLKECDSIRVAAEPDGKSLRKSNYLAF